MTKTSLPELSNLFWLSANGTTRNAPRQHLQAKTIPSLHKMENYFFL
jgi:hypothetical protein